MRHRLRFFLFHRKVIFPFSRYLFFLFLNVAQNLESVTSWWAFALRERPFLGVFFEFKLIDLIKGNILNNMEDWCLIPGLFQFVNHSVYSITNYDWLIVFHSFDGTETIKNSAYHLLNINRSRHVVILLKPLKNQTHGRNWTKHMVEMFVIIYTTFWINFTLILAWIQNN